MFYVCFFLLFCVGKYFYAPFQLSFNVGHQGDFHLFSFFGKYFYLQFQLIFNVGHQGDFCLLFFGEIGMKGFEYSYWTFHLISNLGHQGDFQFNFLRNQNQKLQICPINLGLQFGTNDNVNFLLQNLDDFLRRTHCRHKTTLVPR